MTRKLTMMMAVAVAAAMQTLAVTEKVGGYTWTYRIKGDTAEIYGSYDDNNDTDIPAISPLPTGAVTIPSTLGGKPVTSIGYGAFRGCSGLTSVTIPNSVKSIDYAFYEEDSGGLSAVHITDIAAWCRISFGGSSANPLYYAHNLYLKGSLVTDLMIPDGVTRIGSAAFSGCSSLTSVTISDSVTSIGGAAFSGCRSLTSVTIPNSVTNIGGSAFRDCSSLTSVTIPNSVTDIGGSAFDGTPFYNNQPDGLVVFGRVAYKMKGNCPASVTIPDGVTTIGNSAFDKCRELTSVTIPNSVTSIGDGAFYNCNGLTSVTIPNSVTSIGRDAFCYCSGLTSVTMPNSVTNIGNYSFHGCSGLTSVTIPDGVTDIGGSAFEGTPFYNNNPDGLVVLGKVAYRMKGNCPPSVAIPDGVTSIASSAFSGCSGLSIVTIPNSVTSIGDGAFYNCNGLTAVYISDLAAWCRISFDWDSNPLGYAHNLYLNGSLVRNLVIPSGVTSIRDYAFRDCSSLTSVMIPDSVTSIGDYAFYGCSGLTSVTIPSNITSIGGFAFDRMDCEYCEGISIPELAIRVSDLAAWLNISVEHWEGIHKIADSYDLYLKGDLITQLVIPDGVTSIRDYAFYGCNMLTGITIPASVTSIGDYAFRGCSSLLSVTYLGNAPHTGRDIYYGTPRALLVSRVQSGSVGWSGGNSKELPKTWNNRPIVKIGDEPDMPLEVVVVTNYVSIASEAAVVPAGVRGFVPSAAFSGADKMKMNGIVFDSDGTMRGVIQVETAKASAKGVKVKGFVMLEDGKKAALRAVTVPIEGGRLHVETVVGKLGNISLTIGGDGFRGDLGAMKVVSADVGDDAGVLTGSLTLKYLDAAGKVKSKRIAVGGVATGGTAAGTATTKGEPVKVFAAEFE